MKVQTIIYTEDSAAAVDWYSKLLGREPAYRSDMWSTFEEGGATVAVHLVEELPPPGRHTLSLVTPDPLEAVIERLGAAGITTHDEIIDQPFGRSIVFRDPDGSPIQINEYAH